MPRILKFSPKFMLALYAFDIYVFPLPFTAPSK